MRRGMLTITLGPMVLLMTAGCGDDRAETVAVTGTVTYRQQPVEGARVMFMAAKGPSASGTTDAEGRFELMTFEPGDGAVVGSHKVLISKKEEIPDSSGADSPYKMTRDLLPPRYGNPAQSGLTADVQSDGKNDFPFELSD